MVQPLQNNGRQFLTRLNVYLPQDPANPLIREMKPYVYLKTHTDMFMRAFFTMRSI